MADCSDLVVNNEAWGSMGVLVLVHKQTLSDIHLQTVAPINPATLSFCAGKSDFCWDGFTCFKTSEACTNGGCGRCDDWSNDQNYGDKHLLLNFSSLYSKRFNVFHVNECLYIS